jgi:hypothetical protein
MVSDVPLNRLLGAEEDGEVVEEVAGGGARVGGGVVEVGAEMVEDRVVDSKGEPK